MENLEVNCMMCLANLAAGAPYKDELSYTLGNITHAVSIPRWNIGSKTWEVVLTCTLYTSQLMWVRYG